MTEDGRKFEHEKKREEKKKSQHRDAVKPTLNTVRCLNWTNKRWRWKVIRLSLFLFLFLAWLPSLMERKSLDSAIEIQFKVNILSSWKDGVKLNRFEVSIACAYGFCIFYILKIKNVTKPQLLWVCSFDKTHGTKLTNYLFDIRVKRINQFRYYSKSKPPFWSLCSIRKRRRRKY